MSQVVSVLLTVATIAAAAALVLTARNAWLMVRHPHALGALDRQVTALNVAVVGLAAATIALFLTELGHHA